MARWKPEEERLRSDIASANIATTYIPKAPNQVRALHDSPASYRGARGGGSPRGRGGGRVSRGGGRNPRPPRDPKDLLSLWCAKVGHSLLHCLGQPPTPAAILVVVRLLLALKRD